MRYMTYENHISLMCSSHRRTALIGMQFSQGIYLTDAQLSQACSSHRAFSDFEKEKSFCAGFPLPHRIKGSGRGSHRTPQHSNSVKLVALQFVKGKIFPGSSDSHFACLSSHDLFVDTIQNTPWFLKLEDSLVSLCHQVLLSERLAHPQTSGLALMYSASLSRSTWMLRCPSNLLTRLRDFH
jgi:hypothetical protein